MLRSDDAVIVGEMQRHSSPMLVQEPGTQAHARVELSAETPKPLPPPPPIIQRPTNTRREKNMEHVPAAAPKRTGFSWKALILAFILGLVVMAVVSIFFEWTPTDRAVKRLSSVNVDMTNSYRSSTEAFSKRLKVLEAKVDRLLDDTQDQDLFVEPKTIPVFEPAVVEVCGITDGLADICDPSGNWKWIPPLKDDEWEFCKTEDGEHVPCNFKRLPTFVGHEDL